MFRFSARLGLPKAEVMHGCIPSVPGGQQVRLRRGLADHFASGVPLSIEDLPVHDRMHEQADQENPVAVAHLARPSHWARGGLDSWT